MGTQNGAGALAQFQAAARLDPTNPEPFAYSGWLIRLQGFPDQGLSPDRQGDHRSAPTTPTPGSSRA